MEAWESCRLLEGSFTRYRNGGLRTTKDGCMDGARTFLLFALKKTALLFSSCCLPGSTATSGFDNLELVRASEVYFLLMYVAPGYFTRASRTELVKRAVGGDAAICSALQVTSGSRTADQGDGEHLGKGKDIHRQNPILGMMGMRWTWTKKIPECKRSENSASTISRYAVLSCIVWAS
ncbi:hypothetical protein M404DRAFT_512953 [Pisolithus tinctorius Marx 270]|uniref:Uncharacterized protein n=1 Tax=Pisolithus tinctorius Marx 270 TaxID=870435 RepID=A0A0C3J9A2_PISTI|nr:hypothetical protein M404DRAFT_512953 [Pisolithus tinctorius Marx 270]